MTGVGEVLKARKPGVQIVAVEPDASPVLSGGQKAAPHPGHRRRIRSGHPQHRIYDEVIRVQNDDAFAIARRMATEEGLWSASRPAPRPGQP